MNDARTVFEFFNEMREIWMDQEGTTIEKAFVVLASVIKFVIPTNFKDSKQQRCHKLEEEKNLKILRRKKLCPEFVPAPLFAFLKNGASIPTKIGIFNCADMSNLEFCNVYQTKM